MSCTLTEYRKPVPRYGLADAGWFATTRWEIADGLWQRLWRHRYAMSRKTHGVRRARVWRKAGAWTWNVCEWDARHGVWVEIAREAAAGHMPYAVAQAAWPFADLAARTGPVLSLSEKRRTA